VPRVARMAYKKNVYIYIWFYDVAPVPAYSKYKIRLY
jgi:hypothetical protein